jgi:myo-inositol-1-phosphate synthase
MSNSIRVAIFGVGNCAKSLVEGVALYSTSGRTDGLAFPSIGGYTPRDIEFVLAYDVDGRKVGKSLSEAIYAKPNCASNLVDKSLVPWGHVTVKKGVVLDGVASHMSTDDPEDGERFYLEKSSYEPTHRQIVDALEHYQVDVALIYLPVGSERAVEFYVNAMLEAGVPFVNCIPVFIVSNPTWQQRITEAGIPAIGDDMRSQVGASILSQVLQEMFLSRGAKVNFHCQTNMGGNTDFMNMLDRTRLSSKKVSKENVIRSQNELRGLPSSPESVHAGPADYVPYLKDNKVAHVRIEAEGFGGAPITLDCRLSVQDSPNSAGVVIDAIRYLQTARRLGIVGPLYGPSSATQKTPPQQMKWADAYIECVNLASTRFKD